MEDLSEFYRENIISWNNLISKGYFDGVQNRSSRDGVFELDYGKTDVIYTKYFNLNELTKNKRAFEYIKK